MTRPTLSAGLLAAAATLFVAGCGDRTPEPRYRADQCTSWAYAMRPDLTRGTLGLAAADWERWARDNGYRVDTQPRAGDIAVWDRNIGAGPEGHVAYVEAVHSDGGVFVSERNIDGCSDVAFIRLAPERLSTALFIHRWGYGPSSVARRSRYSSALSSPRA